MGPEDAGAEFFDLGTAETTDDLRRVLVLYPPVRRAANAWSTTSSDLLAEGAVASRSSAGHSEDAGASTSHPVLIRASLHAVPTAR